MIRFMGRSEIKRLRKKGWSLTQIAQHVGVHRNTVARLLKEPQTKQYSREPRPDAATPYIVDIHSWIEERMPVERMLEMVREDVKEPYTGCRSAFFEGVSRIRQSIESTQAQGYTRFEGLPGEYVQVDWGEIRNMRFLNQPAATRYFLAVRLKYSRISFLKWTDSMRLEVLLRGLLEACEAFGGVPWVWVFDNMKTVTLGRDEHNQPIWHPVFEQFAEDLDFKPEACDKGCPNQKGSVENLVGWVKSNFLPGRKFADDADLERQSNQWAERGNCERHSRAHGEIPAVLLPEEQAAFTPLKHTAESYGLFGLVTPNREGRVNLGGSCYQVPIGYAAKPLVSRLRKGKADFYDGDRLVASYPRSGAQPSSILFEPEHLEPLLKQRPRARVMVYRDYLMQQIPAISTYVVGVCSRHRGDQRYGHHVLGMFQLLRLHGAPALAAACALAAEEKAYGVDYLEHLLQTPTPRPPVSEPLRLSGVPTQGDVDRGLAVYELFAVGGANG